MSVFVDLQAAEGTGVVTTVAMGSMEMEMEHGASSSLARRVVVRLVTRVSNLRRTWFAWVRWAMSTGFGFGALVRTSALVGSERASGAH